MSKGIAVVGNVFVDIKGFPFGAYIPAGRNAGEIKTVHGGVGRNLVEDIANMELRPVFVSTVDDSAEGREVIAKLKRHKTNTDYVLPVKDGMGIWLAIFDETGDVAGSISKRPDMEPLRKLIDTKGDEIFSDCDSIVLEIDLDKEIAKSVLGFAAKYGKKVYAVVANITIAAERRDLIKEVDCIICNRQEAGLLFVEEYENLGPDEMREALASKIKDAGFKAMVVTMGADGSVYADASGSSGVCPARAVAVCDTTGAGDAFGAGVAAGLTYGCSMDEAMNIGTRIAASVIVSDENVCPRFLPTELGINPENTARKSGKSLYFGDEDIEK